MTKVSRKVKTGRSAEDAPSKKTSVRKEPRISYEAAVATHDLYIQDLRYVGQPALLPVHSRTFTRKELLEISAIRDAHVKAAEEDRQEAAAAVKVRKTQLNATQKKGQARTSKQPSKRHLAKGGYKKRGRTEKKLSYESVLEKGVQKQDLRYLGHPANAAIKYRAFTTKEVEKAIARQNKFKEAVAEELNVLKAENKARRDSRQKKAAAIVAGWKESKLSKLRHSTSSILPLDVWTKILETLCDDLEMQGVRGPSVVARDISNAARVSKELYAASPPAFQRLSTLCNSIDTSFAEGNKYAYKEMDALWSKFMVNPRQVSYKHMRDLCSIGDIDKSEPKEVLMVEVMKALYMTHPSPAPAQLIIAVAMERHKRSIDIVDLCARVPTLDTSEEYKQISADFYRTMFMGFYVCACTLFRLREDCVRHGIMTLKDLKAAASPESDYPSDRYTSDNSS